MPVSERKQEYFATLEKCLTDYQRFFIVGVDHVGSKQVQDIRMALRGKAQVLMGKNTMIRKKVKQMIEENPSMEESLSQLMPALVGNIGFVFTDGDLKDIRDIINNYTVPAAAKAGVMSSIDVQVPAGPTGLDPAQTSFFQALNVPTKINKGSIEILTAQTVISVGNRVGSSEAALLNKLGMKPFEYGLKMISVFEGGLFPVDVLEIGDSDLMASFGAGMAMIASVSLACGILNEASFPHVVLNSFKDLLAVAVETDYDFKEADATKAYLKDPSAFASATPSAAATPAAGGATPAAAAAAVVEDEEEEEDIGFDLFD